MAPAYAWFLALRYLVARWVNVLGMTGIAVAVWALIVVISVFSGFIHEIRQHIRGATADLVLTDVFEDTSYADIRALALADPDVTATAPRLKQPAILFPYGTRSRRVLYSGEFEPQPLETNCVNLIGIDPAEEARATGLHQWLGQVPSREFEVQDRAHPFDIPQWLHKLGLAMASQQVPDGDMVTTAPGLVLGYRRMQRGERIMPGQLIDVLTARIQRDGDQERVIRSKQTFVAGGAFETKHRTFDEFQVLVHIDDLREMLGQDPDRFDAIDVVSEVAIKLRADADPIAAKHRLTQSLGEISGGHVETWQEQNAVFLGAVDLERSMMKLVLFIVMLVAGFLIYATLHMMVMQKVRDIGILTSLGATPRGIAAIFVVSASVIAAVGCAAGTGLGLLSAHYLNDVNDWFREHFDLELFPTSMYDLDRIPYRIDAEWVVQVVLAAAVLSLVVAWFPARRAARLDPVRALSHT